MESYHACYDDITAFQPLYGSFDPVQAHAYRLVLIVSKIQEL